jgi:hypothetical protein
MSNTEAFDPKRAAERMLKLEPRETPPATLNFMTLPAANKPVREIVLPIRTNCRMDVVLPKARLRRTEDVAPHLTWQRIEMLDPNATASVTLNRAPAALPVPATLIALPMRTDVRTDRVELMTKKSRIDACDAARACERTLEQLPMRSWSITVSLPPMTVL